MTLEADVRGSLLGQLDSIGDSADAADAALDRLRNGGAVSDQELEQVLDLFLYEVGSLNESGSGVTLQGSSGPAFRYKNWGVSVAAFGNGGAGAVIDLNTGIALTSSNFVSAIPNPDPNACMDVAFCEDMATRLVAAGNTQLDRPRAEELANAAGPRIEDNVAAQDFLVRIVQNTTAGDQTLGDNGSGAITAGVIYGQVAGTYSHKIISNLAIGANLKYMTGETSLTVTRVSDLTDGEQIIEDIFDTNNTETVSDFGFDLGVMWRPTGNSSIGLVGNNLNSPSFDFSSGRRYEFEPSFRIGGAWAPLKWFNVAADYDLNELDSQVLPGISYRYLNLGTEFRPLRWFHVQLGAFTNLAADNSDPAITAGLGFNIGPFEIALAGAMSTGVETISVGDDSQDLPREAAVALQLAWRGNRAKKYRTATNFN